VGLYNPPETCAARHTIWAVKAEELKKVKSAYKFIQKWRPVAQDSAGEIYCINWMSLITALYYPGSVR